jgi:hypothetical protein
MAMTSVLSRAVVDARAPVARRNRRAAAVVRAGALQRTPRLRDAPLRALLARAAARGVH